MNWDKPLSNLREIDYLKILRHHGFNPEYEDWGKFLKVCGHTSGLWEDLEEEYLNYCKFMSSPLGKALS